MNQTTYDINKDFLNQIRNKINNMPEVAQPYRDRIKNTGGIFEKTSIKISKLDEENNIAFDLIWRLMGIVNTLNEELYKIKYVEIGRQGEVK